MGVHVLPAAPLSGAEDARYGDCLRYVVRHPGEKRTTALRASPMDSFADTVRYAKENSHAVRGCRCRTRSANAGLLVSVDGLRPDYVLQADHYSLKIPH